VRQDLHERVWREQIAGRQSRRITQSERRAVDAYDVDQEATLQLQTLRPAALAADLAPDRLEQLLREPVLTRLEYRRDQLRQRYGSVLDEHTSCRRVRTDEGRCDGRCTADDSDLVHTDRNALTLERLAEHRSRGACRIVDGEVLGAARCV